MKKKLKKSTPGLIFMIGIIFMLIVIFLNFSSCSGRKIGGMKEYTIFLGRPMEDYPVEGTILGDWIEKKTKVKIKWEFPVGELETKAGLMVASGDYPDIMDFRNSNQFLYDAGAFIPLDDLIEKYGNHCIQQ